MSVANLVIVNHVHVLLLPLAYDRLSDRRKTAAVREPDLTMAKTRSLNITSAVKVVSRAIVDKVYILNHKESVRL